MKKVIGIGIIIFLIIAFVNKSGDLGNVETVQNIQGRTEVTLDRVVDGDTLVVNMNGDTERVRLIGVDTPESTTEHVSVECFGQEASQFLKDYISFDQELLLEFDDAAGQRDRYDRVLAHVFLENGENVNQAIIEQGYGYEYTYQGQGYKYKFDYKQAQKNAEQEQRGLWAESACM